MKKALSLLCGAFFLLIGTVCGAAPNPGDYPIYLEAESATEMQGFGVNGLPRAAGHSGDKFLNLWRLDPPEGGGYYAKYHFTVPKEGEYWAIVWAQGLDTPYSSPFWFNIDQKKFHCTRESVKIVENAFRYGEGGTPHIIGPFALSTGSHQLTIEVNEQREYKDKAYNLILDAIAFTDTDPLTQINKQKCAELTIDAATSLGSFVPMTDMSEGGVGAVSDPNFWAPIVPMLKQIGTKWVRIDHIFDDSYYGTVSRNPQGKLEYSWEKLDKIIEQILAIGAKPYFSVSYMPGALSKTGKPYGPPRDFNEWKAICAELVRHMQTRWGLSGLYYEIWNEPDLKGFWEASLEEYLQLYRYAYEAIRSQDKTAKIGGPAGAGVGWIEPFLQYIKQEGLGLDFVSWHHYGYDTKVFSSQISFVNEQLNKFGFPASVEKIYSEWNIDGGVVAANDSFYNAGHAAAVLYRFHEQGLAKSFFFMPKDGRGPTELFGQWGAITFNNRPKPVYNFFAAYARLKGERVKVETTDESVQAFAVFEGNKGRILVWNYGPGACFGTPRKVVITLKLAGSSLREGKYNKSIYMIDSQHSNLAVNPQNPGLERISSEEISITGDLSLSFELENGAVALVELLPL